MIKKKPEKNKGGKKLDLIGFFKILQQICDIRQAQEGRKFSPAHPKAQKHIFKLRKRERAITQR